MPFVGFKCRYAQAWIKLKQVPDLQKWVSIMSNKGSVNKEGALATCKPSLVRFSAAIVLALSFAPSIAKAELNLCTLAPQQWESVLSDTLVGSWAVQNGPGAAQIAGMTIPLPPSSLGTLIIDSIGGELNVIGVASDFSAMDFEMDFVTEENWTFSSLPFSDDPPPYENLNTIALTYDLDCPADLPRIRFFARIPVDGTELAITMDVVLLNESTLAGTADFFMPVRSGAMEASRMMVLTR